MAETKEETFAKDPRELEEGHFEKEQREDEQRFKDQFETTPSTGGALLEEEAEGDANAEGSEVDKGDAEGAEGDADFNFDDSIKQKENEELEELNAKLGTNFETLNELKESIKASDQKVENSELEMDRKYVNYYETVLAYDDKTTVLESLKLEAVEKNENLKDPDVIDRLNAEVEELEDNKVLKFAADSVRNTWRTSLNEKKSKVDAFDNKKVISKEEKLASEKEKLQETIGTIFKEGKFLGITPSKEDLISVYQEVVNGKHIEHLQNNPEDAVKFGLFKKYQSEIEKVLSKPTFNDGVKKTLEKVGFKASEQTVKNPKQSNSDQEDLTFLESFIK